MRPPLGIQFNWFIISDIDECQNATDSGGSMCFPVGVATCNNLIPMFECVCPSGYAINDAGDTCQGIVFINLISRLLNNKR